MEKVFIDTSAIYAFLSGDDMQSPRAISVWKGLLERGGDLFTNNYVLVEAAALLQNRIGISSVRAFQANVIPFLRVIWIDERSHAASFERLLAANRRNLSLVDCNSFETMKNLGIERAFTFDEHFREQGFTVIP